MAQINNEKRKSREDLPVVEPPSPSFVLVAVPGFAAASWSCSKHIKNSSMLCVEVHVVQIKK